MTLDEIKATVATIKSLKYDDERQQSKENYERHDCDRQ